MQRLKLARRPCKKPAAQWQGAADVQATAEQIAWTVQAMAALERGDTYQCDVALARRDGYRPDPPPPGPGVVWAYIAAGPWGEWTPETRRVWIFEDLAISDGEELPELKAARWRRIIERMAPGGTHFWIAKKWWWWRLPDWMAARPAPPPPQYWRWQPEHIDAGGLCIRRQCGEIHVILPPDAEDRAVLHELWHAIEPWLTERERIEIDAWTADLPRPPGADRFWWRTPEERRAWSFEAWAAGDEITPPPGVAAVFHAARGGIIADRARRQAA